MARYSLRQLFRELRRRRVFNTIAIYIVGAWVVLQAADLAFPGFDIPENAIFYVWMGAFLLFPLVLVFGWKYDIHATGILRTPAEDAPEDFDTSLQKPDRWLVGGLGTISLAVIAVMVVFITQVEPGDSNTIMPNSIAVMPFDWCGEGPGDIALAGGIHTAVIDRLAVRERLKVIGRNSVYNMATTGLPPDRYTDLFRVQYLLQGELCRDGADLILAAELTDRDQTIVWSGNFRQRTNVDERVEQQLATVIANGVALELGEVAMADRQGPVSAHALEQLLIAQHLRREGKEEAALTAVEKALEYEPDYAEALFLMALLKGYSNESVVGAIQEAWPLGEKALELARAEIEHGTNDFRPYKVAANVLMYLAAWERGLTWRAANELGPAEIGARKAAARIMVEEAESLYRTAIRLNPSNSELRTELVHNLERQGAERRGEVLEILEQGRLTEPFDEAYAVKLAKNLALRGQYTRAIEELERFTQLGDISADLRWVQLEIQNDQAAFDDKLALLLDMLQNDTDKFYRAAPILGHLFWTAHQIGGLGLDEESEALYQSLTAIPERADATEFEHWVRQYFLLDLYDRGNDREEEVARERLAEVEGLSNAEILDRWHIRAANYADSFWEAGELDRAIELYEALRHYSYHPFWANRGPMVLIGLAGFYWETGRVEDARRVIQEIVDILEAELAAGARHPGMLFQLATAYAALGQHESALEVLALAVDYGHWWSFDDSEDELPFDAWEALRDDPRFQGQERRMQAIVEGQADNVRALLATYDIDALLAPVIEVHAAAEAPEQEEQVAGNP